MDVILRMVHANEACVERLQTNLAAYSAASGDRKKPCAVAVAACRSVLPEPTAVRARKFPKNARPRRPPSCVTPEPVTNRHKKDAGYQCSRTCQWSPVGRT